MMRRVTLACCTAPVLVGGPDSVRRFRTEATRAP
jgi:hypothetical protein